MNEADAWVDGALHSNILCTRFKMVFGGSCLIGIALFAISQLALVFSGKSVSPKLSLVSRSVKDGDPWKTRVSKAWEMLHSSPCKKLQYGENCTELKSRRRNQMNVYTADKERGGKALKTVLVERVKGHFKDSDAVLVLDPYPDAHFGHTVIVFLVEFVANAQGCHRKGTFFTTGKYTRLFV